MLVLSICQPYAELVLRWIIHPVKIFDRQDHELSLSVLA
jgi:hypothetical protein